MSARERPVGGYLAAAISTAVVHLLAERTGKGPTKTKTTLGENGVFLVLQDTLTKGERNLAPAGERASVLDTRRRWQRVMHDDVSKIVEELTGRPVVGFLSDNHIDPDLAVEVFVLKPVPEGAADDGWGDRRRTSRAALSEQARVTQQMQAHNRVAAALYGALLDRGRRLQSNGGRQARPRR